MSIFLCDKTLNIDEKVIWITGGGTGIGKAVAIVQIKVGMLHFGRRENILKKLKESIQTSIIFLDVNDKGKCFEIMNNIKDEFGDIDLCFFYRHMDLKKKEKLMLQIESI